MVTVGFIVHVSVGFGVQVSVGFVVGVGVGVVMVMYSFRVFVSLPPVFVAVNETVYLPGVV